MGLCVHSIVPLLQHALRFLKRYVYKALIRFVLTFLGGKSKWLDVGTGSRGPDGREAWQEWGLEENWLSSWYMSALYTHSHVIYSAAICILLRRRPYLAPSSSRRRAVNQALLAFYKPSKFLTFFNWRSTCVCVYIYVYKHILYCCLSPVL